MRRLGTGGQDGGVSEQLSDLRVQEKHVVTRLLTVSLRIYNKLEVGIVCVNRHGCRHAVFVRPGR